MIHHIGINLAMIGALKPPPTSKMALALSGILIRIIYTTATSSEFAPVHPRRLLKTQASRLGKKSKPSSLRMMLSQRLGKKQYDMKQR